MEWCKQTDTLYLSAVDMQVLAQCDAAAGEIFQDRRKNAGIPPLWSVLSYVLLQERASLPQGIWREYRYYLELAQTRDHWYVDMVIPKASGGQRRLAAPHAHMAMHQRAIDNALLQHLPVSDHAYAYRKGVNIRQCAEPHMGQEVLFHLDIENFFGSITEAMVARRLREDTGYAGSLCDFFARMCCYRGRLPQGAPTSPVLSNIVFRPCDEELARLAREYGMQYTRYSDDMFFSGGAEVNRSRFLEQVEHELYRKGFRMKKEKTKVLGQQNCQKVLGLTVNQHLQVNRRYRRRLLQEVYYLKRFGEGSRQAVEQGYERYMEVLQGKLAYALSINPEDTGLQDAKALVERKLFRHRWELFGGCST